MSDKWLFSLTIAAALGCGLIAGVFFAFSSFVMRALGHLPPSQGIAAMQSINVKVINPWFMTPFLGTAAICLILAVSSLRHWQRPDAVYLLVGGLAYLLGTFVLTMVFHVPRNNALAVVDPTSTEAARLWTGYLTAWTIGNHVRTVAALAAATLLTWALALDRGGKL